MTAEEADSILLHCLGVHLAHNVCDRHIRHGMGSTGYVAEEVYKSRRAGAGKYYNPNIWFSMIPKHVRLFVPAEAAGSSPLMCTGCILLADAQHTGQGCSPGWAHIAQHCSVAGYTDCYCCCSNCRPS
jgi:hypothetical protein